MKATWPEFLSISELLQGLTPPSDPDFAGAYDAFLYYTRLAEQIDETDLPQVLDWAARTAEQVGAIGPLPTLLGQLAYRGLAHLKNEAVRKSLAGLILRHVPELSQRLFVSPEEAASYASCEHTDLRPNSIRTT